MVLTSKGQNAIFISQMEGHKKLVCEALVVVEFYLLAVCCLSLSSPFYPLFAKVGHDMHVDLSLLPHIGTSALKTVPNSEKQSHRSLRKRMQTAGNSLQMKANVGWNYPGHDPKSGDLPFVVRKVTILCFPRGPQYQCWTCIQHRLWPKYVSGVIQFKLALDS